DRPRRSRVSTYAPRRPSLPGREGSLRGGGEPLVLWLVVEEEDGAVLGRQALGIRGREGNAPRDERAQRVDVDLEPLEEAQVHVDAAGAPELRADPHQARVSRLDQ